MRERSVAAARTALFERLSGLPADQAPGYIDNPNFRVALTSFPRSLNSELASCLDRAAGEFLRNQGIEDEPVAWQPPIALLGDLEVPGPDPKRVDTTALHEIVQRAGISLQAVAAQLDTTIDVVRHLLYAHPLPYRPPARKIRVKLRQVLSRDELVRLYHEERLSLGKIATTVGVSRHVVRDLANEYGIAVRPSGAHPKVVVDAEWLYEQYVIRQRTLNELALEIGTSAGTMNRWAHIYNIPLRPRGRGHRNRITE